MGTYFQPSVTDTNSVLSPREAGSIWEAFFGLGPREWKQSQTHTCAHIPGQTPNLGLTQLRTWESWRQLQLSHTLRILISYNVLLKQKARSGGTREGSKSDLSCSELKLPHFHLNRIQDFSVNKDDKFSCLKLHLIKILGFLN